MAALGARIADCHLIAGVPITVCKLARTSRSRVLKAEAEYGYCAAQDEHYYGWNANLLIALRGVVVGITSPAANGDERDAAYDRVAVSAGVLLGDNGCIRPQGKADCEARGLALQTPLRKHMKERRPRWWLQR